MPEVLRQAADQLTWYLRGHARHLRGRRVTWTRSAMINRDEACRVTKSLWLSYAWTDNEDQQVEFIAQELSDAGLNVKMDRWTLQAGNRLWDQIESMIQDSTKSDAWAIYATDSSLSSQPCREEYAYALDRALSPRGVAFPVIGIFSGHVDHALIPAGIRTRLYVRTSDPDWQERVVAAVEGRPIQATQARLEPYVLNVHQIRTESGKVRFAVEVRPRLDVWNPFVVAIPAAEKDRVNPSLQVGPTNQPGLGGIMWNITIGFTNDQEWWFGSVGMPVSKSQSAYLVCDSLPSRLLFGTSPPPPQYIVTFGNW